MNHEAAVPVEEVVKEPARKRRFPPYPEYRDSGVEWLNMVPTHWQTDRLKWTVTICRNGIWGDEPDGVNDVTCVRVADFDRTRFVVRLEEPTIRAVTVSQRNGRLLRKGDLLLEKSGGGDLQPVGVVMLFDQNLEAVCSNFVARMPVATGFDGRFLTYFHAHLYSGRVNTRSIKQTTGIQNLDSDSYLNEHVPYIPLPEQRAIAAFLDRETARIDELIAKKQRLTELLAEKRTALISHAVTKGLNPDAPMKDTGIDWLGRVPEHWEVVPLRWHFAVGSGEYISNEDMYRERSENAPHPVFGGNGTMGFAGRMNTRGPTIVLGRVGALCGNVHLVNGDCWVTDNALRLSTIHCFDQGYLALQLQAMDLNRWANTNAQPLITGGMVKDKHAALPPLSEQKAILAFFSVQASGLDRLVAKVGDAIDKLREYRSALISAAVTGKIDVRMNESEANV